jgi:hypothetical protein
MRHRVLILSFERRAGGSIAKSRQIG